MFSDIYFFYNEYEKCMDGGFAETMSAIVTGALDQNWDKLAELEKLTNNNSNFEKFILDNINSSMTGNTKGVQNIKKKSKRNCTVKTKTLCKKINIAATEALKYEVRLMKEIENQKKPKL